MSNFKSPQPPFTKGGLGGLQIAILFFIKPIFDGLVKSRKSPPLSEPEAL
jgi:hypothetical protein